MNTEVGVVRDISLNELRLYTDYGRCSRPLFIVENQRLLIKKSDIRSLQQKVLFLQSSANSSKFFFHYVCITGIIVAKSCVNSVYGYTGVK